MLPQFGKVLITVGIVFVALGILLLFSDRLSFVWECFDKLEVGGVIHNDFPTFRVDNMPYGGVKDSGFGREGVSYALDDYTERRILAVRPGGLR